MLLHSNTSCINRQLFAVLGEFKKSNPELLHDYIVDWGQSTNNIANRSDCYKPNGSKLRPHQIAARLLMDFGRNVSLADYGFLMFVSTRQELTTKDHQRYRELIFSHGAIASSLICGLPLGQGGQTNV